MPLHLNSTWTLQQFWAYFAYVTYYHIGLQSIRFTQSTLKLPKLNRQLTGKVKLFRQNLATPGHFFLDAVIIFNKVSPVQALHV